MKMVECAEEIYTELETKINFDLTHDIFKFAKKCFIIILTNSILCCIIILKIGLTKH